MASKKLFLKEKEGWMGIFPDSYRPASTNEVHLFLKAKGGGSTDPIQWSETLGQFEIQSDELETEGAKYLAGKCYAKPPKEEDALDNPCGEGTVLVPNPPLTSGAGGEEKKTAVGKGNVCETYADPGLGFDFCTNYFVKDTISTSISGVSVSELEKKGLYHPSGGVCRVKDDAELVKACKIFKELDTSDNKVSPDYCSSVEEKSREERERDLSAKYKDQALKMIDDVEEERRNDSVSRQYLNSLKNESSPPDSSPPDSSPPDSSPPDSSPPDSSPPDSSPPDSSPPDSSPPDSSPLDSSPPDSSPPTNPSPDSDPPSQTFWW